MRARRTGYRTGSRHEGGAAAPPRSSPASLEASGERVRLIGKISDRFFGWGTVYEPGYLREDKVVSVETLVYSFEQDELVWAGVSKTVNPEGIEDVVSEPAKAVSEQMEKGGLLARAWKMEPANPCRGISGRLGLTPLLACRCGGEG